MTNRRGPSGLVHQDRRGYERFDDDEDAPSFRTLCGKYNFYKLENNTDEFFPETDDLVTCLNCVVKLEDNER